MSDPSPVVACHECDALQRLPRLPAGGVARCRCCGARLAANPRGGLDTPLALGLCALILFLIANAFPLLEMEIQGRTQQATLTAAALALAQDGMALLGALVWATSVLVPGVVILATLYLVAAARLGRRGWPLVRPLLRSMGCLRPWGMLDVFMLGLLVAMVKLGDLADLVVGPGLYGYVPLILVAAGMAASLELRLLWERLAP